MTMNFDALTRYLDTLPEKGVPGCDLTVWLAHRPIYRHMSGEGRPGQPMHGDETYWLYSATKVFTMTAAMQLIERGKMALSDPVSRYLPAYGHLTVNDSGTIRPARTVMTLEHLMSMQGGLDYELDTPAIRACLKQHGPQTTTRQLVDAFAEKPLLFDPGTHFRYSLCHDVMAAVIEVVSGMSFGAYIRQNLFDPLGIQSLTFAPTPAQKDRLAAAYRWDERERCFPAGSRENQYMLSERYESGGAGLMGDVDGYILLADALANDGVGRTGARILTRASIDELRRDRLKGASRTDFDTLCHKVGYSYALGVRTLVDADSSRSPLGEFGWDGAAGAWTMVDPDRHLSAFYAQHVLGCDRAYDEFHPAIRDLIYEGLDG